MMKIVGISCSPRKGRTTLYGLEHCLSAAREAEQGIETEIVELAGMDISGCCGCGECQNGLTCSVKDDFLNIVPTLTSPDVKAMIIATPVYMGTMTSQCKAFIDRSVMLRRNGFLFRNRIGGVLAVGQTRNGGQELTIQAIHAAMLCHDMLIVGDGERLSHFGATLYSGERSGVKYDCTGLATARNMGKRIASILALSNQEQSEASQL